MLTDAIVVFAAGERLAFEEVRTGLGLPARDAFSRLRLRLRMVVSCREHGVWKMAALNLCWW